MNKYNDKIVNDYILGNDIEEYTIDELEDDPLFMIRAIELSNDYKLYNLCSENVKKNYKFVKYFVYKFKDNIDYICNAADYYLNNVDDDFTTMELIIIMCDLTKNKDLDEFKYYAIYREAKFNIRRIEIENYRMKSSLEESLEIGMGFLYFFDLYHGSEIITDYYAKRTIDDIFTTYEINVEKLLHENFKSLDDLNKIQLNNYLLEFIAFYDSMLSSYLSNHLYLMDDLKQKIVKVKKNWSRYEMINESSKYLLLFERVHDFMENVGFNSSFDEITLLYYAAKKLGIIESLASHDPVGSSIYPDILDDFNSESFQKKIETNSKEKFYLEKVMQIMISTVCNRKTYSTDNIDQYNLKNIVDIDSKRRK